jgi:hypothetical protein
MPGISSGTVVSTQIIDLGFMFNTWYDNTGTNPITGLINFNETAMSSTYIQSTLTTYTNIGSDNVLEITGTLTFTSNLYEDYSSGGQAKALFEGGSTVRIVGGLKQDGVYVYGGTGNDANQIFEATLRPVYDDDSDPSADRWSLEEESLVPGSFNRTLILELVEGSVGLASGITIGTDTLIIEGDTEYPRMKLELKTPPTITVNDFGVDINSSYIASHVKVNSIPEPATLTLIGLAAVLLRARRKR